MEMTPREATRHAFRLALFRRRGADPTLATEMADRCVTRDRERDQRRFCEECSHWKPQWRCGRERWAIPLLLNNCHHFTWATPK